MKKVESNLEQIRKSRGVPAMDLAARVGVTRQSIHAMERGEFVPNTELALRMAMELETTVDEMFSLPGVRTARGRLIEAEVLGTPEDGQPVKVARLGARWIGVPVSAAPYYLQEADGHVEAAALDRFGHSGIRAPEGDFGRRLVIAGCDPASGLLAAMIERHSQTSVVTAGATSTQALEWLKKGRVHVAGIHLRDDASGEFNLPVLRTMFSQGSYTVVNFASWEQGLVVAPDNPKGVRGVRELAKSGVRFVNREEGSGSRMLVDQLLQAEGIPMGKVQGYAKLARGHLAAAYAVNEGAADCCLATAASARAFGLSFVPLRSERYDLVVLSAALSSPGVQAMLEVLQRAALRRKLETLAGYETGKTGAVLN